MEMGRRGRGKKIHWGECLFFSLPFGDFGLYSEKGRCDSSGKAMQRNLRQTETGRKREEGFRDFLLHFCTGVPIVRLRYIL
jgi:hypothetical protein